MNPVIAKYRDLLVSRRSIICLSLRLRQIIDLLATDKSRCFAITEFNKCFTIRSPSFSFLMNILGKRSDLPFSSKSVRKKEKSTVSFTQEQNIICSQTLLDGIAHEQTIICRQLFSGHVVGSRPMKRKKNLLGMVISVNVPPGHQRDRKKSQNSVSVCKFCCFF